MKAASRVLLSGTGIITLMVCGMLAAALTQLDPTPESFESVKAKYRPSEGQLLDRQGKLLHEIRLDPLRRRAPWVALKTISPKLITTLLRIEDRRFYQHRGVDWRALLGTIKHALTGRPLRGASTISMQLVGLLAREQMPPRNRAARSFVRKWSQMQAARALELTWSKAQILEAYLNLASFRGEVSGIGAASRSLLNKSPAGLDSTDSLLLVSLLRSPNAAATAIGARGCRLIEALKLSSECAAFDALTQRALAAPPQLSPQAALAPHVARRLLSPKLREVTSSLELRIQRVVLTALQRQLDSLRHRNVNDGAAVVIDNATGEVLAYVGNTGERASAYHVDGVKAPRQAGSTLKPFLYGLALEQKLLTAASLLDDSPLNLQTPSGLYVPQNYDHEFKGPVSLRTSLAASLNIPAVRTLMLVGAEAFIARLRHLGFAGIRQDADYYGYALALGSPEVSLWELVNAYRVLAAGGEAVCPATYARTDVSECKRTTLALNRAASFIVSDILSDRSSRGLTFGLEGPLSTPYWAAVKTGTSKHMRDNWCVGYSARYTVGVWVGNFDGAPMHDVSGVTGAAPVWAEILHQLHAQTPSVQPPAPPGVIRGEVTFANQIEAPRSEWFLDGTAATTITATATLTPRIIYPGRDSVVVLDPDIPAANQRIFFAAHPNRADLDWRLNGKRVSGSPGWSPTPGSYTLSLRGAEHGKLDEVRFQVRGTIER